MSLRIYQPDRKSKGYIYIIFFSAVAFAWSVYIYSRPLVVASACSEIALNTSGLTKSFKYDPLADYDQVKANCLQDVLSSENSN